MNWNEMTRHEWHNMTNNKIGTQWQPKAQKGHLLVSPYMAFDGRVGGLPHLWAKGWYPPLNSDLVQPMTSTRRFLRGLPQDARSPLARRD
jgi:hypothetical protein